MTENSIRIIPFLFIVICVAVILWFFEESTGTLRDARRYAFENAAVLSVAPAGYDNAPLADRLYDESLSDPDSGVIAQSVFRCRNSGAPLGLVFKLQSMDGYHGEIDMMVGVDVQGSINNLLVVSHQEDWADAVVPLEDGSAWLKQFKGLSLELLNESAELPIDHISGATITSRAIINAIRECLLIQDARKDDLFR